MMYICNDCGMLFIDGGECPSCGSKHTEEAAERAVCGKTIPASKAANGVCIRCLRDAANVQTAIGFGWRYTDAVEINGFLSYFFGADRINEILMNALVNSNQKIAQKDAEIYCFDDVDCFSEYVDDTKDEPDRTVRFIKKRKGVRKK